MSFADTFDAPMVRIVAGKSVTVPPLTTRDYLPWVAEESVRMRAEAMSLIPETEIKATDKIAARKQAARVECTLDELARQVLFRPEAQVRLLKLAAKKAGLEDDAVEAFIDAGGPRQNQREGCRLSRLFGADELVERFPDLLPTFAIRIVDAVLAGDADAAIELVKIGIASVAQQRAEAEAERLKREQSPND